MARIKLPRTVLEEANDGLVVRHIRTGVSVAVSESKLDSWCIAQLRSMISAPAVAGIGRGPGSTAGNDSGDKSPS